MELERKFLLKEPTKKLFEIYENNPEKVSPIDQYYILLEDNKEMRVRKRNLNGTACYSLTVKDGAGGMRTEVSFNITKAMYEYQKEKAIGYIHKDRLTCELDYGLIAEIDFFDDFIMAEVEFKSGYQYMEFEQSEFIEKGLTNCVCEVTTDNFYKNRNLAVKGFK